MRSEKEASAHRSEANAGDPRRGQGAGRVARDHHMHVEARNPKDLHAFGHLLGNDHQVVVRGDVVRREQQVVRTANREVVPSAAGGSATLGGWTGGKVVGSDQFGGRYT